jgi:hypothetical protein
MSDHQHTDDLTQNVIEEQLEHTPKSRASMLAQELADERKRLVQELEELQTEFDAVKPATPTGTVDWYIKWLAMMCAVVGVFLISADMTLIGQIFYIISSVGWVIVGMSWGDRAIMIGSAISGTAVTMNVVQNLSGTIT